MIIKSKKEKYYYIAVILILLISNYVMLYFFVVKEQNSFGLYYDIKWSNDYEDVKKVVFEQEEHRFPIERYEDITTNYVAPSQIRQFTILEYGVNGSILLETTPGTRKPYILYTEKLPNEIANYLREMYEE